MTRTRFSCDGLSRRSGLMGALATLTAFATRRASAQTAPQTPAMTDPITSTAFSAEGLRHLAQTLAQTAPRLRAPPVDAAQALNYDQQRDLKFKSSQALWAELGGPFRAELFPAVYLAARTVDLYEVEGGQARPITFAPEMFDAPEQLAPVLSQVAGLSGFRLLWPLNAPDRFDEIGAFQGASYFRSLGRNQHYGLSARGLSIRTGDANEEFPHFTAWWIERPAPGADRVVLHALLESESVTGAYRFQVIPGENLIFDVEAVVYPRRDVVAPGVAPMSSMFLFGSVDRPDGDDFRSAVHDSDGLAIRTADGEAIWRPLTNPRQLRMSRIEIDGLAGFGLLQRSRNFDDYGDLEARYDRRPSLWVTPLDDWGPGAVHLLEIPTRLESDDNMACFWRPRRPWPAGAPVSLRYRLTWGDGPAADGLAQVTRTRTGAEGAPGVRLYTIDFAGVGDLNGVERQVTADAGEILRSTIQPHATPGGARVALAFRPSSSTAEISVRLLRGGAPISETWRYRWSA